MITYVNVPYIFNFALWGEVVASYREKVGAQFLADYLQVNKSTIMQWSKPNSAYEDFPHPSMHNFLKVCNELNLRPSDFFTTEE